MVIDISLLVSGTEDVVVKQRGWLGLYISALGIVNKSGNFEIHQIFFIQRKQVLADWYGFSF